jgi:di/tricarboxylate transporter
MTRLSADSSNYAQALLWASAMLAVALLGKGARHLEFLLTLMTVLAVTSFLSQSSRRRGAAHCRPQVPEGS